MTFGFGVWEHCLYCNVSEMQQMGESVGRRGARYRVAGIHHHAEKVRPREVGTGDLASPADLEWKLSL